jgi:hypothetical protein
MRSMSVVFALVCLAGPSASLGAQGPGPRPAGPGHARTPGVSFLLSHTGSLELTDAQLVKLAAIARKEEDRHKALRAGFDSLRAQWGARGPGGRDSSAAGRRDRMAGAMATFKKEHDAMHADLRDAIAVLNPDQQAKAWEIVSMHREHARGARRGGFDGRRGGARMERRGPGGGPGGPGRRADGATGDDDEGAMDAADDDTPDDVSAPPGR